MKEPVVTYIPSGTGFHTIELVKCFNPDGYTTELTPIIAWEIRPDLNETETNDYNGADIPLLAIIPITPDGRETTRPIVYPDGRVHVLCLGQLYDSADKWMEAEIANEKAEL